MALALAAGLALAAHAILLEWLADRLLQPPPLRSQMPEPVFTRLLQPQDPPPLPVAPPAATTPPAAKAAALVAAAEAAVPAKPPASAASKPGAEPVATPQAPSQAMPAATSPGTVAATDAVPGPAAAALPASPSASTPAPSATAAANVSAAADPLAALWPQDARINYLLGGQFRGGPLFGGARVQWVRVGADYQAQVEIRLPLGQTLAYTSQGRVDAGGLTPLAYEEARGSRRRQTRMTDTEVVMHDGKTLARPPGLQDMASQFIELGHRLRTGRLAATLGGSISLPLARPGGIDLWTYDITAQDTVRTPRLGDVVAVRLTPRPVSHPRGTVTAEFWFAPSLQYLPARVRVSMGEEAFIDLVVESIEQR